MMNDKRWLWIIGGGLLQIPLIEEAKKLDLNIIVTDGNNECAAKKIADRFEQVDIFDIDANVKTLAMFESEGIYISGVLAAGIDAPITMATLNQCLGLKGVSIEVSELTQQKDKFRDMMRQKNYPTPQFVVVKDVSMLKNALFDMKIPFIVKPPANSASRDMRIFGRDEEVLALNFTEELLSRYDRVLIEEVWSGEEQTVECLIDINGKFHRGFITDRKFRFDNGFPVETGLVHPTELSFEKQEELYLLAERLATDFNIQAGAVKLDTIYTSEGPRLIEMAVRHSGGFDCQYLVPLSTGKNILKAAILTAIQIPFPKELLEAKWRKFGATGSVWPKPGKIIAIKGLEAVHELEGVANLFMRYQVGDEVLPYIDCSKRVAFIICVGDSREAVFHSLKSAQDKLVVVTSDF